ncbi:uncharacterized protein KIAA1958-like [Porites lutea]|uniref:uncharacterized protein KIAA1958-like n=1 Tax=Porites lutea TaxID=51062 RepID=UPI003CC6D910
MASSSSNSRFADITSVEEFIEGQENENTRKKTEQNVALLKEFLRLKDESRPVEEIPPHELSSFISEFIITVRKKENNEDYEPTSLRAMMASFERYLKKKNYGYSIMRDVEFEKARTALKSKQRDLKKKGKGDKPNASVPLTEDDIKLLYDKGLLGKSTPEALLNTVWFNNTVYFGLRGCKEHRDMCWGDVQLRQTTNGEEFLEYTERQTKTRTGENPRDVRQIKPKMFSVQGSERDPVTVYKFYAEKRPSEMNDNNAPFYLAVNNRKKQDSSKPWFKKSAVGVNKLNSLMKKMAEKAGLGPNVKNHSGRKTMIQTLTNNDIPATDIIQLSGHKNLQSVTNYSVVSEKQQVKMSRTLSELMSGNVHSLEKTNSSQVGECSTDPSASSAGRSAADHHQQAMSLFTGAVIHGGQFSISINSLNQSPKLAIQEVEVKSSPKRYKRLKVLDSDSD